MSTSPPQLTYYIVVCRLADPDITVRHVARLVQDEEENVKRKLQTRTYEVLGRFARRANAEGLRQQLFALGVPTFILSDQDIRGHMIVSVASANRGAGGMALRDFEEKPLYVPFEDIAAIAVIDLKCENGLRATLIDLHRHSTNITPRLDAALFDFEGILQKNNAGLEDFLKDLQNRTQAPIDRDFSPNQGQLIRAARDFAARPAFFPPPRGRLISSYVPQDLDAANLYSIVMGRKTQQ